MKPEVGSVERGDGESQGPPESLSGAGTGSRAYHLRMDPMTVTEEQPFEVARVEAEGGATGADAAFVHLEGRMQTLEGRRMYGVMYRGDPERYFACVRLERHADDDLGFERAIVPGGRYGQRLVRDWEVKIPEFPRIVDALHADLVDAGYLEDTSRPSIEYYRRSDELLIMVPVLRVDDETKTVGSPP